ncbi:MAG: hypothetical protein H6726_24450 [Sandaracinaceae bacterium]|nr:hypothetical protein [Sandaracinaceae bacterium]
MTRTLLTSLLLALTLFAGTTPLGVSSARACGDYGDFQLLRVQEVEHAVDLHFSSARRGVHVEAMWGTSIRDGNASTMVRFARRGVTYDQRIVTAA